MSEETFDYQYAAWLKRLRGQLGKSEADRDRWIAECVEAAQDPDRKVKMGGIFPLIEPAAFAKEDTKERVKLRSDQMGLLEEYSRFLEERDYMDSDWRFEEPFAIDEFMKEREKKK